MAISAMVRLACLHHQSGPGSNLTSSKWNCQKHLLQTDCTIRCRWNPLESIESPRTGISTWVALFGPLFTSSPLGSFTSTVWYTDPCQKIWLEKAYRYCLTSFLAMLLLTFKLTVSCKIETRSHMHTCKLLFRCRTSN